MASAQVDDGHRKNSPGQTLNFEQTIRLLKSGYWACGPLAWLSNPNRKGGSASTRPMASRNDHSGASSFTRRVTGPCGPAASNPNREGGSASTRPMASHDDHSGAASFTRRVTGPAARWLGLVTRTVREAAPVHGRWLRVTITQVLPRSHVGLLGLAALRQVTRTVREAAPVHGRWLRMTITQVLPRSHVGLLGLRPCGK